jgi:hypothetical protein
MGKTTPPYKEERRMDKIRITTPIHACKTDKGKAGHPFQLTFWRQSWLRQPKRFKTRIFKLLRASKLHK